MEEEWPAFAYLFGTWGYALQRALDLNARYKQKIYLYQAEMNGRPWWVTSFDPKEKANA